MRLTRAEKERMNQRLPAMDRPPRTREQLIDARRAALKHAADPQWGDSMQQEFRDLAARLLQELEGEG